MNKTVNIKIDRLSLEGDGVARQHGKVAFVPYVLPNESVEVKVVSTQSHFDRALPVRIDQASSQRVTPQCPQHFIPGRQTFWCGGCNWQHMSYRSQLESKRQLLVETLQRLGGVKNPPVKQTLQGPDPWRYRNKVQVPFGGKKKRLEVGFYAPGSHHIVEFSDCVVQPEQSVEIIRSIKVAAQLLDWDPYDEDRQTGWFRHALIRLNRQGQAIVTLVSKNSSMPQRNRFIAALREACPLVVGLYQNIQPSKSNVVLGLKWIHLWGDTHLQESMNGLRLQYHPASFFQVNTNAAEELYKQVMLELEAKNQDVVIDLYCGVGAMTLLAARSCQQALGVELAGSSIRDARFNAQLNNVGNVQFVESGAEDFFERHRSFQRPLVIIDPPRSGCAPRLIRSLLALRARRIIYVSCNPATLARDIKLLSSRYRLTSSTPVDLFPQTSHIESVSRLDIVS